MTYKFAIIGCGNIAQRHAEQIVATGQLVAVCDVNTEKARILADKYNVRSYISIDDLLQNEKIDVVSICTPNGLHAPHSIAALQAGTHVLCEKPMAISVADGKKMVEAARLYQKKLFVVKQNRYNPPVEFVKNLLTENKLGKILSFQVNCFWNRPVEYYKNSWKGTMALDGGTLFTQFSHFIDLLYWFLGDIEQVQGWRSNYIHKEVIEFEDTGIVMIQMANGAMGTLSYTVNSLPKNMEGSITLFGEKGTAKIGGQYLNELEFFWAEGEVAPLLAVGKPANDYGFYEGSMSNHHKIYEHLIKTLNDPNHVFLEAAEALKSVEIIEKIYVSSPII